MRNRDIDLIQCLLAHAGTVTSHREYLAVGWPVNFRRPDHNLPPSRLTRHFHALWAAPGTTSALVTRSLASPPASWQSTLARGDVLPTRLARIRRRRAGNLRLDQGGSEPADPTAS